MITVRAMHTESVTMLLLEIVDESATNFGCWPLVGLLTVDRTSHASGVVEICGVV